MTEVTEQRKFALWIEHLVLVAQHYLHSASPQNALLQARHLALTTDNLASLAQTLGLQLEFSEASQLNGLQWRCPFVVELTDSTIGLVESIEDGIVSLRFADATSVHELPLEKFQQQVSLIAFARPVAGHKDKRVGTYLEPYQPSWLRRIIFMDIRPYLHVMVAALVANVLGLAGILFSMQVYDRVVPGQSMPTLYVLFIGVILATLIAFIMRILRGTVTNIVGKRADLRISDKVFGHALRLHPTVKPKSTGTFIAQLRELEQLRELITSSTIGAAMDMPFFILFLGVFIIIAGPLTWVPLIAVFFMILPPLLLQKRLSNLAREATRESSLRNALLVETIQGLDDVKSMQAESLFLQQWNQYTLTTADSSLKLRNLTNALLAWSQIVQVTVFAVVVFFGAPLAIEGEITTGALVAASILSSRMLAPMSQITQVLTRWQHAKVALEAANAVLELPAEGQGDKELFHRPNLQGEYAIEKAVVSYDAELDPVLSINQLVIKPGEKIALLGRNGAGKSSLLNALAGNMHLRSGNLTLDGTQVAHIDPADVRRDVVLLSQEAKLFHGTLRYNLLLGNPEATSEQLKQALVMSGAMPLVKQLSEGLDHLILEGGIGLSGGQKQSILLARLILRDPNVVLLDEPTASLDETAERHFLKTLNQWLADKTLVVATHRMAVLDIVDRVIVVDKGRVALDAPKAEAIKKLSGKSARKEA